MFKPSESRSLSHGLGPLHMSFPLRGKTYKIIVFPRRPNLLIHLNSDLAYCDVLLCQVAHANQQATRLYLGG